MIGVYVLFLWLRSTCIHEKYGSDDGAHCKLYHTKNRVRVNAVQPYSFFFTLIVLQCAISSEPIHSTHTQKNILCTKSHKLWCFNRISVSSKWNEIWMSTIRQNRKAKKKKRKRYKMERNGICEKPNLNHYFHICIHVLFL